MSQRAIVPLVAACACAASVGLMLTETGAPRSTSVLDAPGIAPSFRLERLDGEFLDSAALHGQIVVLDVWATWCGPCLVEMPGLDQLYREYREQGVTVLGIAVDSGTAEQVLSVAREHVPVAYPLLLGDKAFDRAWGPMWGLPTTLLLDRQWRVRKRWVGAVRGKQQQIRTLVDELIAASGPSPDDSVPATSR